MIAFGLCRVSVLFALYHFFSSHHTEHTIHHLWLSFTWFSSFQSFRLEIQAFPQSLSWNAQWEPTTTIKNSDLVKRQASTVGNKKKQKKERINNKEGNRTDGTIGTEEEEETIREINETMDLNQETRSRWPTQTHIYRQIERRIDKTKGKGKGKGKNRDEQKEQAQQDREKSLVREPKPDHTFKSIHSIQHFIIINNHTTKPETNQWTKPRSSCHHVIMSSCHLSSVIF